MEYEATLEQQKQQEKEELKNLIPKYTVYFNVNFQD
jgi:hypothetical protein